ncbi:MAG: Sodium-transporting two-sector ATPase [Clostridia bacterium]|nr:Sodium-transporting two-sector ATPase [Clostridia bacterium]
MNEKNYSVYSINGPVVKVKNAQSLKMQETVFVGKDRLIGEVISNNGGEAIIQVYESTTGLKPHEVVVNTGKALSVKLGPGIIRNIFDGIERPLKMLREQTGTFIEKGSDVTSLDYDIKWNVTVKVKKGDKIKKGTVYAECPETEQILHRCISPLEGEVIWAAENGSYTLKDNIVIIKNFDINETEKENILTLEQEWPIRIPRPVAKRLPITRPLITGQRIVDSIFPIGKGGTAAIPGGFGTGKTMMQHQLAKWSDADIIVYIGCGERGNEMTQVLDEFAELIDPRTKKPLTDRTVLIANTSNMPVAAREASIYTGITIAEYYRDMGYHVAIMADSTSRWAEALREISGRLEEMPAEEGYPAYLPSRLAEFYERAGYVETIEGKEASITIIGAVSPQGSDFSEPVTQNTKRFVRCFWALDKALAYGRHYPSINWTNSYTEYADDLKKWYDVNVDKRFIELRGDIIKILNEEDRLMEIVKLIGSDVLPDDQRLIIENSRVIRIGFLQQNAMDDVDTYIPIKKQLLMMDVIIYLYNSAKEIVSKAIPISHIIETGIFDKLIRMKNEYMNDELEEMANLKKFIDEELKKIDVE